MHKPKKPRDARAARVAKRKERSKATATTTAPELPTTSEGWIEHARAKVAEHATRPPAEARRGADPGSGWLALADMIARDFGR